jgi:hypothetical protein
MATSPKNDVEDAEEVESVFSYDDSKAIPDAFSLSRLAHAVQEHLSLRTAVRLQKLAQGGFHKVSFDFALQAPLIARCRSMISFRKT